MSYKTKIDEDNAISLYDDENREVYHGVKVIKNNEQQRKYK